MAHPGYHPGWGPPPHLAYGAPPTHGASPYGPSGPPPYHHRPPLATYGPPPGYPPYGYAPPQPSRGGYGPPPNEAGPTPIQPGLAPQGPMPGMLSANPASYAEEKPAAYNAFCEKSVRLLQNGAEVGLSGGMCEDRHVNDFLLCLQCWLWRSFGDYRSTGKPWRLKRLDLSRNALSDASLCSVLDALKRLDLRVERILFAGNHMQAGGMAALTEYVWNCPDALVELDLSNNEIPEAPGMDAVSAFFRCLYNHPSYPVQLDVTPEGRRVMPCLIRFAGNFIREPDRLLADILAKGSKDGKALIRFCKSQDTYIQQHDEFLSLYLPDFSLQRGLTSTGRQAEGGQGLVLRSRSRRRRKRQNAEGALEAAGIPAQPEATRLAVSSPPPVLETPSHQRSLEEPGVEGGRRQRRRRRDAEDVPQATEKVQVNEPDKLPVSVLSEEEQQKLQAEVGRRLGTIDGLPSEQSTREMLSEFTVCMLVARKPPSEIQAELASFLGETHAGPVAAWFLKHVRSKYKSAAKAAGWS